MKKLLVLLSLAFAATTSLYAADEKEGPGKGEMKTVCHPKLDKAGKEVKDKNGKVVEECKQIKVRKKVEGDKVPEKK